MGGKGEMGKRALRARRKMGERERWVSGRGQGENRAYTHPRSINSKVLENTQNTQKTFKIIKIVLIDLYGLRVRLRRNHH